MVPGHEDGLSPQMSGQAKVDSSALLMECRSLLHPRNAGRDLTAFCSYMCFTGDNSPLKVTPFGDRWQEVLKLQPALKELKFPQVSSLRFEKTSYADGQEKLQFPPDERHPLRAQCFFLLSS